MNHSKVLTLRVAGHSEREIAARLGVSAGTAHGYLVNALHQADAATGALLRQYRKLERERLELLLSRWMPIATSEKLVIESKVNGKLGLRTIEVADYLAGDRACELVIELSARMAALYGLDAPRRSEVSGTAGQPLAPLLSSELTAALEAGYKATQCPLWRTRSLPSRLLAHNNLPDSVRGHASQ